jgi:hypothetical protein
MTIPTQVMTVMMSALPFMTTISLVILRPEVLAMIAVNQIEKEGAVVVDDPQKRLWLQD